MAIPVLNAKRLAAESILLTVQCTTREETNGHNHALLNSVLVWCVLASSGASVVIKATGGAVMQVGRAAYCSVSVSPEG